MASWMDQPEQDSRNFIDGFVEKAYNLPEHRPIDRVKPRARSRPMKVLCLGFSRTGTFSLFNALTMLGYKPYHMAEAVANAAVDFPCWKQALEAKFMKKGNQKPWGRAEFDKLLADHDCVLDVPCINFADELIAAYPEAKVVLTERDVEAWLKSLQKSVGPVWGWKTWHTVGWADPILVGPWVEFADSLDAAVPFRDAVAGNDMDRLRTVFNEHYKHVIDICPPEKLLRKPLGSGWEDLCPFLGDEIPDVPYPNLNDSAFFVKFHEAMHSRAAWMAVEKIASVAVPTAAVAALALFLGYRGQLLRA